MLIHIFKMSQAFQRRALQIRTRRNSQPRLLEWLRRFLPILIQNAPCIEDGCHIRGETSHVIERGSKSNHSFTRDAVIRGLEPDDATKRGGTNDRTNGLSPESELTNSRGDCGRRSAAGAARRVLEIMRIACFPRRKISKLCRDRLAKDQRAGIFESTHTFSLFAL